MVFKAFHMSKLHVDLGLKAVDSVCVSLDVRVRTCVLSLCVVNEMASNASVGGVAFVPPEATAN